MHKPVLLHESINALDLQTGELFVDATFGGGGHSREVKRRFGNKIHIIGLDRDPHVAEKNSEFEVKTDSFKNLDKVLGMLRPDAILFDLGISLDQLEETGRGFSFLRDEPLDMRMSREGITAAEILNSWSERALELILRGFGEERNSRKIAHAIVERRRVKPFATTFDLVEVVGKRRGKTHPATKTFQALRIATNEELTALEVGLKKAFESLRPGGRLVVISFHSLEDRVVKNFFRESIEEKIAKQITKKPIMPSEEEIGRNPRSRSAKLRVVEKLIS
ncbi:MAG: 16S rRNA (cytosine(1402)-N(4))-methyltransferase [Candidatus Zambryskibacteria bacterium RIFCSPLOWO2_12_FULL_45_14]|uniref:Ribosomal RNA small subunit methyltransferase H n=2 Tax=Candidatus Zambryskiibacteriota TaxID=1817925 RepID=A0A1G2ULC5_9BACT|nr:MAG: 16S rRNA (cytosine(1402)-N(4))-methyltransferase [Candidatus Zambryskibacteria bacterium RIFCSPLOWO2_02_FULL_44_12b]OHB13418.1 MAG: 16S rRNA (cytosine(1402)-N(4))-methyltransferase [Candidatus Zambryskibacteria bacterium RIFCSPLOWO2_12_FULL_45_14]